MAKAASRWSGIFSNPTDISRGKSSSSTPSSNLQYFLPLKMYVFPWQFIRVKAASIGPFIPQMSSMSFGYPGNTNFSSSSKKYCPLNAYKDPFLSCMKESKGLPLQTSASGSLAFVDVCSAVEVVRGVVVGFLIEEANLKCVVGLAAVAISGDGLSFNIESKTCEAGVKRLNISAKVAGDGVKILCCDLDLIGTSVLFISS